MLGSLYASEFILLTYVPLLTVTGPPNADNGFLLLHLDCPGPRQQRKRSNHSSLFLSIPLLSLSYPQDELLGYIRWRTPIHAQGKRHVSRSARDFKLTHRCLYCLSPQVNIRGRGSPPLPVHVQCKDLKHAEAVTSINTELYRLHSLELPPKKFASLLFASPNLPSAAREAIHWHVILNGKTFKGILYSEA